MMFKNLIGKTMDVYVDSILVNSKLIKDHIKNLRQMFDILRKYQKKLKPLKCAFGVGSRILSFRSTNEE